MNISLSFNLKSNKIPLEYRRCIISWLKHSLLGIADGKYYETYYGKGNTRKFTFAVKLFNPVFRDKDDFILVDNSKIQITFSTGDTKTGFILYSAFIAQKGKKFALPFDNTMMLVSIVKSDTRLVNSNSALVKMLSPLCLREHNKDLNNDTYYSVKNENFSEKAKSIIELQLIDAGFSKSIINNLELIPINCKKTVVKHYDCLIECSVGEFMINADKAIINYFLQYGIGSRKSAGFGFATLILED